MRIYYHLIVSLILEYTLMFEFLDLLHLIFLFVHKSMKMILTDKDQKSVTEDTQIEELNGLLENSLEFLPETPKLKPIDTISNISFMDLEDIESFSLEQSKEKAKPIVEPKFKFSKKKMIRKHSSRKDSDNGVLE